MSTVFLNGEFLPLAGAKVSVLDRGFLFGDAVYEVIPVYGGKPLGLERHLARLDKSLTDIGIQNPNSFTQWETLFNELIARNGGGDQGLYLQVTRGAAETRDHLPPPGLQPTVFAMSRPLAETLKSPADLKAITAITLEDIRWNRCDIKSTSLLGNVLLKQWAMEEHAQEAILTRNGVATEGAASNLFVLIDGHIRTAPKNNLILAGITRDLLVEILQQSAIKLVEQPVTVAELARADEIWMTSSTREIMPVTELDGKPVGDGEIGAVVQAVASAYIAYKQHMIENG